MCLKSADMQNIYLEKGEAALIGGVLVPIMIAYEPQSVFKAA